MSVLDADDLRDRVNKALDAFFDRQAPTLDDVSEELAPALDTLRRLLAGGKRLRAAFCYWGWRGAGGTDTESIIRAAASLELLQGCALIHDDVMDDSDTRRGQPSVHHQFASMHRAAQWRGTPEQFGRGAAILLGDLSLSWADELLFTSGIDSSSLLAAKPVYDRMRTELMAGQYLDLLEQARSGASVERAMRVARFKAAKYTIEGPLHLGGSLAGADSETLRTYSDYGLPLGEAFQLRDDLLGVFGDPAQTGKPAGDDLREGKRTVLVAYALERATPSQIEVINRHLGDPSLGAAEVAVLRSVIDETGAVDRVEQLIDQLTERALSATDRLASPVSEVLRQLALAATSRSS